ncbi:MAG TPA: DEAD/DEAH box helicase [Tetrasphaera sp.]|uniref:DEAD/DEAH box helicase n=1 Tax=Nostocoides sp. TaxID=1917966 RepID=UPI002B683F7B|nr:DEAD/DEAH box helicase [Tetrasphaera sp.]HNQ05705.1 DEAD/DEAH box helicase [Tetrasphaera sp.]
MSPDTTFGALGVPASLIAVLAERGITSPTPIQTATLPDSLAGRDVLGRGRTGSGKTYAFLLPLVARLSVSTSRRMPSRPRALILAPTRELVAQIEESLAPLAKAARLTSRTVFGGVGQSPQVTALRAGVDIVIACPGRLEDLIGQGHVSLDAIEITILDEADHMADLGFLPVVRRLLDRTPRTGQRMLFSATLDAGIDVLAKRYLTKPVTHQADSAQSPVAEMDHHVLHVAADAHFPVLKDLTAAPGRTIVFTRTKHRAKKLARQLNAAGVPAVELHGNLSQNARTRTMDAFHSGAAETLVATDIAARGIHVDDVGLVIHADPPVEPKAYLHRSGRTARAGNSGTVVTMMLDEQRAEVRDLTRKAGIRPTTTRVDATHPLLQSLAPGDRTLPGPYVADTPAPAARPSRSGQPSKRRSAGAPGRRGDNASAGASSRRGKVASQDRRTQGASPRRGDGNAQNWAGDRHTPSGSAPGRRSRPSAGTSNGRPGGGAAGFSAGTRVGSRGGR